MKGARWVALGLLVTSIISGIWLLASLISMLFMLIYLPGQAKLTPSQAALGMSSCCLAPLSLAIASATVWWFGVRPRGRQHTAATLPTAPAPPPATRPTVNVGTPYSPAAPGTSPSSTLSDDALERITATLLQSGWPQAVPKSHVRAVVQATVRQIFASLDRTQRTRLLLLLQRAGLLAGEEPLNLYGFDLRDTDLRFVDLRDARLAGVCLQRARLTGADLRGCDLSNADLRDADLRMAQLDGAILDRANLQQARLHRASLRGARLHGAHLHDANVWEANLEGVRMVGSQGVLAGLSAGSIHP